MTPFPSSGSGWERRRPLSSVVGTLLLVLLAGGVGWAIGRETTTTAAEQVTEVRSRAADAAATIERLDDEYAASLDAGKSPSGVMGSISSVRKQVAGILDDAPWVTDVAGEAVLDSIDAARDGADASVLIDDFQDLLDAAAAAIRGVFGVR